MTWQSDLETHAWHLGDELPSHNTSCVICGSASAMSPLLEPFQVRTAEEIGARVRFDARHQGAPLYAHGGMVAAVLDDACGYVSFLVLRIFVTAHLEIDYRRPVILGHEYEVRARCVDIDGRKVHMRAELTDEDGIAAEATGLFIAVDIEHFRP